MTSGAAIDVRGATKRFATAERDVSAFEDISVTVDANEFVSLLGPSGCGKSTLLNLVAGLLRPTSGEVYVKGRPVSDGTPVDVGLMFQGSVLLDWKTIVGNVLLPIEVRLGRRAARAAVPKAHALLKLVGLSGVEDSYPWQLSGGMQQRVAMCRMLISEPEVLLLDEPFGALDELTRERMNLELQRILSASARAALFVTHSISEAAFLSDRIVVMSASPGRVVGVVDVDFERPRSLELTTTQEFQKLVRTARELLDQGAGEDGSASGGGGR